MSLDLTNKEPLVISYEMAVKGLKAAVETKGPDFTYEQLTDEDSLMTCRYFDREQQPSCIVGHVLDTYGITPFAFNTEQNKQGIGGLASMGEVVYEDEPTEMLLYQAQVCQDRGVPWGETVNRAIDVVESTKKQLAAIELLQAPRCDE